MLLYILRYAIVFLLVEDCNRKSTISVLEEVYKDNPSEFEASENIIKLQSVIIEPMGEEDTEVLKHISISLVEFKDKTAAVTISVIVREDLDGVFVQLDDNFFEVYTERLLYKERAPAVSHFKKESQS